MRPESAGFCAAAIGPAQTIPHRFPGPDRFSAGNLPRRAPAAVLYLAPPSGKIAVASLAYPQALSGNHAP